MSATPKPDASAERCYWPRCRATEHEVTLYGRPLCAKHWARVCDLLDDGKRDAVRELLDLPARAPAGTRAGAGAPHPPRAEGTPEP